jgi:cell division protein FtsL
MKNVIRTLFVILPIAIVISLFVQMVVANQMIVLGDRLNRTERRISELEEQNDYLNRSLNTLSSITRVQTQAKGMGFKEPTSYIAFDPSLQPVALKR